jgi:hypothetical protein
MWNYYELMIFLWYCIFFTRLNMIVLADIFSTFELIIKLTLFTFTFNRHKNQKNCQSKCCAV